MGIDFRWRHDETLTFYSVARDFTRHNENNSLTILYYLQHISITASLRILPRAINSHH